MRSVLVLLLVLIPSACVGDAGPVFVREWGAQGGGSGAFVQLTGVAVSPTGFVYAGDYEYIRKFTRDGELVDAIYTRRWGYDAGYSVKALSISPANVIYWLGMDAFGHAVFYCDSTGTTLGGVWGACCAACSECLTCTPYARPTGVDARTHRGVYASDARWGQVCGPTVLRGIDGAPAGVAVDAAGSVFVTHGMVSKFGADGSLLAAWTGSVAGVLKSPTGIAVDQSGRVYVVDSFNNQVQVFTNDGQFVTAWGSQGSAPGQFAAPGGIAVDDHGNIYVADGGNQRIQEFAWPVAVERTTWSNVRKAYR